MGSAVNGTWVSPIFVANARCRGAQADVKVNRPKHRHEKMAQALLKVTPACSFIPHLRTWGEKLDANAPHQAPRMIDVRSRVSEMQIRSLFQ
jgi:hypothetical protein